MLSTQMKSKGRAPELSSPHNLQEETCDCTALQGLACIWSSDGTMVLLVSTAITNRIYVTGPDLYHLISWYRAMPECLSHFSTPCSVISYLLKGWCTFQRLGAEVHGWQPPPRPSCTPCSAYGTVQQPLAHAWPSAYAKTS